MKSLIRPNEPHVVHEVIDGEAVLINMESGAYYSLDKVGAEIWAMIETGSSMSDLIASVTMRYSGEPAEIERGIATLLAELETERLIVSGNGEEPGHAATVSTSSAAGGERSRFVPPVLHKYTDMTELLLLDPIHEVDEMGWPRLPGEAS